MIVRTEDIGEIRRTPIGDLEILDANIITYPSGKMFVQYLYKNLMEKMVEDMHKNEAEGFDNMIITQGAEGSGKSTHIYDVCKTYDPNFTLSDHYMYDFEAMKARLKEGDDEGKIFWLDEAVNVANKRRWQSKDNIDFTDLLIMMRSRLWCVNMAIPRAADLDFYVRDHRFRYLVTVKPMGFPNCGFKKRGYWELQRKNPDTNQLEHIGYGLYDDMPPEAKAEYKKVKESAQLQKFEEINNKKTGYKEKYESERKKIASAVLAMHNSGIDRKHIMDMFGIETESNYYMILKRARDRE